MKKQENRNPLAAMLFLCYGALMVYLLFFRNRAVAEDLPYWEQVRSNCNFTPFHTIGNYWDVLTRPEHYLDKWVYSVYRFQALAAAVNILGNVAMFVPLGGFVPAMWQKLRKLWLVLPIVMAVITVIEVIQLLTLRGRCDIDDLLLNMVGALLGYALWRFIRWCKRKSK